MACVRQAWLHLDSLGDLQLENPDRGYFCTSLDLGAPTVREVVDNLPNADGAIDRTTYMGPRAVAADIVVSESASASSAMDMIASMFGPYMVPNVRPVLHYILDNNGSAIEHTLVVRPAVYQWALTGPTERNVHLGFVAADPVARDPAVKTSTAYAGSAAQPGRTYPLVFDRTYPTTGGSSSSANMATLGDVAIQPFVRIYGPIAGAVVQWAPPTGTPFRIAFLPGFMIAAGSWVDIDTRLHTAFYNSDPAQPVLAQIDWATISWPILAPNVFYYVMTLSGASTTGVTQVVATFQDGYLS